MKMILMPALSKNALSADYRNLPYIAIVGALIAAVASMKIFAGSEVSIFTLEKAYSAGVTPEQSQTLINQAALAEFMRGLGLYR